MSSDNSIERLQFVVKLDELRLHPTAHKDTRLRLVAFSSSAAVGAHFTEIARFDLNRGYVDTVLARAGNNEARLDLPLGTTKFQLPHDTTVYVRVLVEEPDMIEARTYQQMCAQDPGVRERFRPGKLWSLLGTAAFPLRTLKPGERVPIVYNYVMPEAAILKRAGVDLKKALEHVAADDSSAQRDAILSLDTERDLRRRGVMQVVLVDRAPDVSRRMCAQHPALSHANSDSTEHVARVVKAGVERGMIPYRSLNEKAIAELSASLSDEQRAQLRQQLAVYRQETLLESQPGNKGLHFSLYTMDSHFGMGEWFGCNAHPRELHTSGREVSRFFANALRTMLARYSVEEKFFVDAVDRQLRERARLFDSTVVAACVIGGACSIVSNEVRYNFDGTYFPDQGYCDVEQYTINPHVTGSGDCEDTGSLNATLWRAMQRLSAADDDPLLQRAVRLSRHFVAFKVMSTVTAPNMEIDDGKKKPTTHEPSGPLEINSAADMQAPIGGHMYAWVMPVGQVHRLLARAHGNEQADALMNTLLEGGVHSYTHERFHASSSSSSSSSADDDDESFHTKIGVLGMEGTCESLSMIGGVENSLEMADRESAWYTRRDIGLPVTHVGEYLRTWSEARGDLLRFLGGEALLVARHTRVDADLALHQPDVRVSSFYRNPLQICTPDFREAGIPVNTLLLLQPRGVLRVTDQSDETSAAAAHMLKGHAPAYGVTTRDCVRAHLSPNVCLAATLPQTSLEEAAMKATLPHAGVKMLPYLTESSELHTRSLYESRIRALLDHHLHPKQRSAPLSSNVKVATNWRLDRSDDATHLRLNVLFSRQAVLERFENVASVVRRIGELYELADVRHVSLHLDVVADHNMPGAPVHGDTTVGMASLRCDILVPIRSLSKLKACAEEAAEKRSRTKPLSSVIDVSVAASGVNKKVTIGENERESFLAGLRSHPHDDDEKHLRVELCTGSALPLLNSHSYHFIPEHIASDATRLNAYRVGRELRRLHRYHHHHD